MKNVIRKRYFSTYDNTVAATLDILALLNVRVTATTVKDTLLSHPDYPSLLSIVDALRRWNVSTFASKMPEEKLPELPCPFIAHLEKGGGSFMTVTAVEKEQIVYMDPGGREARLPMETFIREWDGVALLAEADAHSGEADYRGSRMKELWSRIKMPLFAGSLLILGVWQAISESITYSGAQVIYDFLVTGCKILGLAVTGALLWYEYDANNPFLMQVCSMGKKTNCHAILSSNASKIAGNLSWSDIGFIYFAGSYLCLLLAGTAALPVLIWLNVLALPYIFFSVYYQWRIAKQWCVLCLTVQAILLLEFISALTTRQFSIISSPFNIQNLTLNIFLLSFLLPAVAWLFAKPLLYAAKKGERLRHQLARLKGNEDVFHALLQGQPAIQKQPDGLGITIGNPDAQNILVKVCNPYCGPCASAHPKIEELVNINPDWKAQIIFTATGEEKDKRTAPAAHLMAIAEENEGSIVQQVLDDWYNAKVKDYDVFAVKYPMNGELKLQTEKLQAMDSWCKEVGITYTPTFFVNGYRIPEQYSLEDLKYL